MEHIFGDMAAEFEFDEEGMEYIDAPVTGLLRRKSDGAWFAFDCQTIIWGKLWHWTLVPLPGKVTDVVSALQDAGRARTGTWLSIVEDRRGSSASICRLVEIDASAVRPVIGSLRSWTT
jgi:hypothetical protein